MYNTSVVKEEYIRGTKTLQELSSAFDIPELNLFRWSSKGNWVRLRKEFREKVDREIQEKTIKLKAKHGVKFDQKLIKGYEVILGKTLTRIKRALKDPKAPLKVKSLEGLMNSLANLSQTYRELTGKKLESKPTIINVIKHYDNPPKEEALDRSKPDALQIDKSQSI